MGNIALLLQYLLLSEVLFFYGGSPWKMWEAARLKTLGTTALDK